MKGKIDQIYHLSVELYYEIADYNMKHRGHPGPVGPNSNEPWDLKNSVLEGSIRTLQEVLNKLNNNFNENIKRHK